MDKGEKVIDKNSKLINVKLIIEYDGKKYFGWQKQKNKPTIQQTIEEALQVLIPGNKIKLTGAGRTDTGVHALNQTANFRINKNEFNSIGRRKFLNSLNAILPGDIAIKNITKVGEKFNSRYSAKKRTYIYYFSSHKTALYNEISFRMKTKFDVDLAKDFCKLLIGVHSFKNFCKNKTDNHDFKVIIYRAGVVKQRDGLIRFEICANRFLHSMVRAIAGMMLNIVLKKITIEEFKNKFYKGVPLKIQFLPSNALFLKKIIY